MRRLRTLLSLLGVATAVASAGAGETTTYTLAAPFPMETALTHAYSPVSGGHTALPTEAKNASGLAVYTFPESSVGMIASEKAGNMCIGDALAAPEGVSVDWVAFSTNLASCAAYKDGYFFYSQSTNASDRLIVSRFGTFAIDWPLVGGGTKRVAYETGVPKTVVPHRLFWTSAPFNGPGVSIPKNYGVKLFGDPSLFAASVTTNQYGSPVQPTYGVKYDADNNTCLAYAEQLADGSWRGPKGEFVVAYYDSGTYERYLGCTVVEVTGSDVIYLRACVGDELRPQNENYDPASTLYMPVIQTTQGDSTDERAPYVFKQTAGSGQYHAKNNRVFAIAETLPGESGAKKAEVYWESADAFNVFWPFEQTCYHLTWPDCPTVVIGAGSEPGPGLTVPTVYTASALDWRVPRDVVSVTGSDVTLKKSGRFTLRLTNQDQTDFWLVPLNVAYSDDPDKLPSVVPTPWSVGSEVLPQAVAALRDPRGAAIVASLDLSLAGYIYAPNSLGLNWNPQLYHYDGETAEGDFASCASAIYFVNVVANTDYDAEVWWRRSYSRDGMPEPLTFPVLPQRYKAVWPTDGEAQEIVLASGKGSAAGGFVQSGASVYLPSPDARATVTCTLAPQRTGGSTIRFALNPAPAEAFAYDTVRKAGDVFSLALGDRSLTCRVTRPSADGEPALCRLELGGEGFFELSLPAAQWTFLTLVASTERLDLYAGVDHVGSAPMTSWMPKAARECVLTVGSFEEGKSTAAAGVAFDRLRVWDRAQSDEEIAAYATGVNADAEARAVLRLDFDSAVIAPDGSVYDLDEESLRYFCGLGLALVAPGCPTWTDGALDTCDGIAPRVYYENDVHAVGYNPNEEHAVAIQEEDGRTSIFALRSDMNDDEHPPYVLAAYNDHGRGAMKAYRVFCETSTWPWPTLQCDVAQQIKVFHPFDVLPKGLCTASEVSVADVSNDAVPTYRDRTGRYWGRRDGAFGHVIRYYGEPGFVCTAGPDGERDLEDCVVPFMNRAAAYVWPTGATARVTWATGGSEASATDARSPLLTSAIYRSDARSHLGEESYVKLTNTLQTVCKQLQKQMCTDVPAQLFRTEVPTYYDVTWPELLEKKFPGPTRNYQTYRTYCGNIFISNRGANVKELDTAWGNKQGGVEHVTRIKAERDRLLGATSSVVPQVTLWPSNVPLLSVAQVLTRAEGGLPDVYDMKTCAVAYPYAGYVGDDGKNALADHEKALASDRLVKLIDPTCRKTSTIPVSGNFVEEYGFKLGSEGNLVNRKGYYYFTELPPVVSDRLFVDVTSATNGCADLVLVGDYHESAAGVSYLRVNSLSTDDFRAITNRFASIAAGLTSDTAKARMTELIRAAKDIYDQGDFQPSRQIGYQKGKESVFFGVTNICDVVTNVYYAADHYALIATGEGVGKRTGTNHVVLVENDGPGAESLPVRMHVLQVGTNLYSGKLVMLSDANNVLSEKLTALYTAPLGRAADNFTFEWWRGDEPSNGKALTVPRLDEPVQTLSKEWTKENFPSGDGLYYIDAVRNANAGSVSMKDLVNRYWTMRYHAKPGSAVAKRIGEHWSAWCQPTLAEGWLQRVLNAITPFSQRLADLSSNKAELKYTMPGQIGAPWKGDVALNNENLTSVGLEQLYRTILNRAEAMSIAAGKTDRNLTNAAVNRQLAECVARLADMEMTLGAEAYSDAQNPLVSMPDGEQATGAVFCFANQVPTLLDEELALLRGRTSAVAPALTDYPCYNRLMWNFTKGVTQGEVAYVNNYNISASGGVLDANAAAAMYPQGHGDAYGYYLTAVKDYYRLLRNPNFEWGEPSMMSMLVADHVVNMDYQEEDKFAEAAMNLAKIGAQVVDLTARKQWKDNGANNDHRTAYFDANEEQAFGYGEWGCRAGYGAFVNWAVANSILPSVTNTCTRFADQSIATVSRETSASLAPLARCVSRLENTVNAVDAGLNPLGLSENAIPFDISPADWQGSLTGQGAKSHYEQIRERAVTALGNAETTLAYAGKFGSRLRAIENAEVDANAAADEMEASYDKQLVAIYGRPFADDIGPGKTYAQGYTGPDLYHYMYMDLSEYGLDTIPAYIGVLKVANIDWTKYNADLAKVSSLGRSGAQLLAVTGTNTVSKYCEGKVLGQSDFEKILGSDYLSLSLNFSLTADGFVAKPSGWVGQRACEGSLQAAYRSFLTAYVSFKNAYDVATYQCGKLESTVKAASTQQGQNYQLFKKSYEILQKQTSLQFAQLWADMASLGLAFGSTMVSKGFDFAAAAAGENLIVGPLANSVPSANVCKTIASVKYGTLYVFLESIKYGIDEVNLMLQYASSSLSAEQSALSLDYTYYSRSKEMLDKVVTARDNAAAAVRSLAEAQAALQGAMQNYRTVQEEGRALLEERTLARTRLVNQAVALRYQDMYARIARNTALSTYATSFDVAQRYVFELAKVYDYETGLDVSDSASGRAFVNATIATRALGTPTIVTDNSVTDGGLWDLVNRMDGNFAQLKGRLGINNPDVSTKWFSLRYSLFRLPKDARGDAAWREILNNYWVDDIRADRRFARYCEPPQGSSATQAEPGLIIPFGTAVNLAENFFGKPLLGGETTYSSSDYAVKIFAAGVGFDGYDELVAAGKLAQDPNVYLVPTGKDYMRAPLTSSRKKISFTVVDQVLPLPYDVGEEEVSATDWVATFNGLDGTADSAAKIRRHSTLRADGTVYSTRLVGRSVWNDGWILVVPAAELLGDRAQAKLRFIGNAPGEPGVKDIRIGIRAYSRSGN